MRVLLTNDDGIHSAGIQALWQQFASVAEVTVVAPDSEKSATSQAITVHQPIYVDEQVIEQAGVRGWRVVGTPTDCVKIALETNIMEPPDLIVSGINHGPNIGTDVLYSGTVSAAIEGALHGIPAIAVSLDARENFDFTAAAQFAVRLARQFIQNPLPPRTLLNVNVPALPPDQIAGVSITKLGCREYRNAFHPHQDPRGRIYYWMSGEIVDCDNEPDTDVEAVKAGRISVTPIHFDLTKYNLMDALTSWKL